MHVNKKALVAKLLTVGEDWEADIAQMVKDRVLTFREVAFCVHIVAGLVQRSAEAGRG